MNRTARRTHLSLRTAVSLSAKKTGQLRGFHQKKNQLPVSPWHFERKIHAPKETKCEVNLEGLGSSPNMFFMSQLFTHGVWLELVPKNWVPKISG